ncbi:MAG: class I SAM-dependent methyltransferase [Acidimicrobiales bacterium]
MATGADDGRPGGMNRPWFARLLARASEIEARKGGAAHRRRLLAGLEGRVVEVGAGTGNNFAHYPDAVTQVVAVEPEANLRAMASAAARAAPVPVQMLAAFAEDLPAPDGSMDAAVVAGVLCRVPDQARVLAELRRVLRPRGQLRFYEHVAARNAVAAGVQNGLAATVWPRVMGGCHPNRHTEASISAAGFDIEHCERFTSRPTMLSLPVAPRILGRARSRR